jgi:hypothetical protein
MLRELTTLWTRLEDAEYLHLVLEQVPLFGLGFGLLFLIIATAMGEPKSRLVALIVIAASCLSVAPYVKSRAQSTPRILAIYDKAFHPSITQQIQRRVDTRWYYYGMAALAIATIFFARPGVFSSLLISTIVAASVIFLHTCWLHRKECEVFHPNVVRTAR